MTFTKCILSGISALAMGAALTACKTIPGDSTAKSETKTKMTKSMTSPADLEKHLYLEEVEGEKALAQVKAWNAASAEKMETPLYKELSAGLLEIYNSPEKIPYVSYRNGWMHNFWQDDKNVKGVWRRASRHSYLSGEPGWDTVLDIDALAEKEGKNWVYKGNNCLAPSHRYCIVNLSIGGKDAVERREFDTVTKRFVNGGFFAPESKGATDWVDEDHLLIGVDFGDGTMTDSGYPRQARLWKRGTALADAQVLFEVPAEHIGGWSYTVDVPGGKEIILQDSVSFFERDFYVLPRDGEGFAEKLKLPLPRKSSLVDHFKGQQIVWLQEGWRDFSSGSIISFSLPDFIRSGEMSDVSVLFAPAANQSVEQVSSTKSKVLISIIEDVKGSAYAYDFGSSGWTSRQLNLPENGVIAVRGTNSKEDIAFLSTESLLTPDAYWTIDTSTMELRQLQALPEWFDASTMVAEQKFVTSSDGTKVPYFIVHSKDINLDGSNPTLLYGYGGFRISMLPTYNATIGKAWLERGGIYVLSNIRGGEEYGPAWHQAGLKENRQLIYDDFIAIAEDLIESGVTSPEHLGIHGRSNGGLLMGVMFTQRPDLFNAVTIGVPLLDMQRYHMLLAGASWVGEYGDPDDDGAEGEFIRTLSPYHQLKEGVDYPMPYIYTSTKDDRVHPGHARKFAERLEDMGVPFYYYENIDGGHAGAANLKETAHSQALIYSYLWSQLGGEE